MKMINKETLHEVNVVISSSSSIVYGNNKPIEFPTEQEAIDHLIEQGYIIKI